jgi:RNA polymerase sigma-70 factor (ECF subfamily)
MSYALKHDRAKLNLFLAHRSALVDYATPIVGDRMRAEDVVQEAYLRFMPTGGLSGPVVEQPIAYLYRIVRNLAVDWTRRRAIEHRERDVAPVWWAVPATPRTPEQDAAHRQTLDRVEGALGCLPPDARLAVEMHRFGGYSLKEIASRLGVSVPTAHRIVRDALVGIARSVGTPDRLPSDD